jgi:glucosamine--fructose-6-phosphate aminotransferase (isomerizing)
MCGIVAYVGDKQAAPILIKGLKRLEYRGYDSAGIAILDKEKNIKTYKKAGKVSALEAMLEGADAEGNIGIGHTRWATHGEPNDVNAHPHFGQNKTLSLVHNGIIENYASIKAQLQMRGHVFASQTDTEVLIHLIEEIYLNEKVAFDEAVRLALNQVHGAYAIVVISKLDPEMIVAARKGSPLVVGIGVNEFFMASDASPIIEYTKSVVYLNDSEMAIIQNRTLSIKTIANENKTAFVQELDLQLEMIEKGGYEHFMLKEIYEQPRSIFDSMRGRIDSKTGHIHMGGLHEHQHKLMNAKRIIIVACGTSWHAGLVAEYLFEDFARIPVEVEYASEFRYRDPVIFHDDIVIAISQSGETADTLAAIELAKSKGATVLGVCNVVGSSIPRATHSGAYTHAGPEIGVASTKAFTAQVTVLAEMALWIGFKKGAISQSQLNIYLYELEQIPSKVEKALQCNEITKQIAAVYKDARNFLYLGRGYNFPVALEGALKLKEISYIHAEGYPAAEMKHGPIALIDAEMPVVIIATQNSQYDKVLSNIQEVKARKGKIISVVTEGDIEVEKLSDYVIEVPDTLEPFMPLVSTIPLQLLSYHIAVMRGCNVDQPRNLAKSVTVE